MSLWLLFPIVLRVHDVILSLVQSCHQVFPLIVGMVVIQVLANVALRPTAVAFYLLCMVVSQHSQRLGVLVTDLLTESDFLVSVDTRLRKASLWPWMPRSERPPENV